MDATIKSSFWTDDRLEEQPPEIKLACLWLITNPSRDLCGFTRVSNKRFTFETGLSPNILEGACKALPSSFVSLGGGVYFVAHFLRHQFGKGGHLSLRNKVLVAAVRHAASLPAKLADVFFAAYPELANPTHVLIPHRSPIDPPSDFSEGVRVREGEGAENGKGSKGKPDAADPVAIAALYPRRDRTAEAVAEIAAQLRKADDPAALAMAMESGVRAAAAVIRRIPSGARNAYLPSAFEYFRGRRYLDDPETLNRATTGRANGATKTGPCDLGGRKPSQTIHL